MINADDYYGQDSFAIIADFLKNKVSESLYAMVGYVLKNTLSDQGDVNRGVCEVDDHRHLSGIVEQLKIRRVEGGKVVYGHPVAGELSEDAVVSMNFWDSLLKFSNHLSLVSTSLSLKMQTTPRLNILFR